MKTWDFVGLASTAWVDLPSFAEIQAAPFFGSLGEKLAVSLKNYHCLPKSSSAYLSERMENLQALKQWLLAQDVQADLFDWLKWLADLAEGKARYLSCLHQIFEEGWHQPEQLRDYLCVPGSGRWKSLSLTLDRYLFPERAVFWGNYEMECLDPCHRQLPGLYKVWESLPLEGRPFYLLWLEQFSSYRHDHWVRYLSEEEADLLVCRSEGGLFVKQSGRPLNCPERQHFLFVIDLEERLLLSRAEPHLCHASYTRGQAVLAAGVLQAREGRLTHLKFESGHYLSGPTDWWQAIALLLEGGFDLESSSFRLTVFDRYRYLSRLVDGRILGSFEKFSAVLGIDGRAGGPQF